MLFRSFVWSLVIVSVAGLASGTAKAADKKAKKDKPAKKKAAKVSVETVVKGLNNPSGVAIQPESGQIFVSDSGNLKVVKYDPKSGKTSDVVTGFPKDVYGKGPMYDIGPLGLGFLNGPGTLVVGGGGYPDGEELLRIYDVSSGSAKKADDMKYKLGPITAQEGITAKGEGNFYGVAVTPTGIYVTCNGDDTKGWVSKVDVKDNEPGAIVPFIKTKEATQVDAPVGITVSKDGNLVIGQMGEMNVPNDGLLTVYNAETGKLLLSAETGLSDIAGLAFNPKNGKLYAVDFSWIDTSQGGLFRLDVKRKGKSAQVKAVKVASLDRPSAIAFDGQGNAYVTVFGDGTEGGKGALVKISGIK